MERKPLSHKPLVEAVFELRWGLKEVQQATPVASQQVIIGSQQGISIDPNYKIMVGRLYERIKDKYPITQPLPTAAIPDEIAGYVVRQRFRPGEGEWPVVQIGPGILTLNETEKYVWDDFSGRIPHILNAFFEVYPPEDLDVNGLLLRYIDAIDFDFGKENIWVFLKELLKTGVNVPESLFDGTGISETPFALDLRFSFASSMLKGAMHLRFARGAKGTVEALVMETMVQSIEADAPKTCGEIMDWVQDAHDLAEDWFFKLIEGELQRRFE